MVPQIVRALLSYYKGEGVIEAGDLVYDDPFSGSGTTAVEGRLADLNTKGERHQPACGSADSGQGESSGTASDEGLP